MKLYVHLLAAFGVLSLFGIASGAEIYKCTDADGNVAYLQLPCPEKKPADDPAPAPAATPEAEADESPQQQPSPSSRLPDESFDECRLRFRDQIDAIDAELGPSLTATEAQDYRERLRALTLQLRACE